MKKILMLCLTALLVLCLAVPALGETVMLDILADGTQVTLEVDTAAVTLEPIEAGEGVIAMLAVKEGFAPVMISIAADDLISGVSMSDLTDEDMETLRAYAGDQFANPSTELATTPSGNQFLCVYEADQPVWSVFTLYHGYFIELVQANDDLADLTQEDADFCLSLLYGIEITPAE